MQPLWKVGEIGKEASDVVILDGTTNWIFLHTHPAFVEHFAE